MVKPDKHKTLENKIDKSKSQKGFWITSQQITETSLRERRTTLKSIGFAVESNFKLLDKIKLQFTHHQIDSWQEHHKKTTLQGQSYISFVPASRYLQIKTFEEHLYFCPNLSSPMTLTTSCQVGAVWLSSPTCYTEKEKDYY